MAGLRRCAALALMMGALIAPIAASDWGFAPEEDLGLALLFQARGTIEPPAGAAVLRLDRESFLQIRTLPQDAAAWPAPLAACAQRYPVLRDLPSTPNLESLPRAL